MAPDGPWHRREPTAGSGRPAGVPPPDGHGPRVRRASPHPVG